MFSSSTNATLSIVILSWPLIFFLGLDGLWKWRRNSVQNANTFYYLSVLGSTKGLHNWRSIVQNVWTTKKCPKKIENVNMAGWKKFVVNAKEVKFVTTTNEDQSVVLVVENRFTRTICNDQSVKNVVVVPSANIKRSGQSVEAVTEDLSVSMKK